MKRKQKTDWGLAKEWAKRCEEAHSGLSRSALAGFTIGVHIGIQIGKEQAQCDQRRKGVKR